MKLAKKRESGQILILVLILLAIGPLLAVPMLRLSYTSQRYHQLAEISTLNVYAADAGIEWGRYQVYNYPADIQTSNVTESFIINGVTVNVTAGYVPSAAAYAISSTATKAGRSETIECMIVIDVGLFGNVVACDGDLEVNQTDFVNEDFPGESDIYTNGDITLNHCWVDGDVTASGNITLNSSNVTGGTFPGSKVLEFPAINTQVHRDRAQAGGNYTGNYQLSGGTHNLGPLYINGNLTIKLNASVILLGTVYITGYVDINKASFSGMGDIISEGNISMTQYAFLTDYPDTLPMVMSVNGNVTLVQDQGQEGTQAVIYAPSGTIDLNQVEVWGSVAAQLIRLNQSEIHYPAELRGRADLPGAGLDTLTYLYD